MRTIAMLLALVLPATALAAPVAKDPTWWDKYTYLLNNGEDPLVSVAPSSTATNVDVSNECGPQSETYIAINPSRPRQLAAGSNEIFRLPMRGYFSTDSGASWGGVDLPLPARSARTACVSGPTRRWLSTPRGNLFYGYIVVFFSAGNGIKGTEMAVARSTDGGKTYPQVTFFSFAGGADHFNDKPMITTDTNAASRFRDSVYIAWDAASGGSAQGGGLRVARSRDHGKTFTVTRADDPAGPGRAIGARSRPARTERSTWRGTTTRRTPSFQLARSTAARPGALQRDRREGGGVRSSASPPSSTAARSSIPLARRTSGRRAPRPAHLLVDGSQRCRKHRHLCQLSDDKRRELVALLRRSRSDLGNVDRFNHWLAGGSGHGRGGGLVLRHAQRHDRRDGYMTDIYLVRRATASRFGSRSGVSNVSSNEHDCNGVFPCPASTTATSRETTRASPLTAASSMPSGPTAVATSSSRRRRAAAAMD